MRGGLRGWTKKWGSGLFRLVKRCVCTVFFFFFFSAWLGRFGRYRPIRTESARFGPRRRRFQPRRPDSGIATWHDATRTRGLRRPSRVAVSHHVGRGCAGLGAASVHPRGPSTIFMTKISILGTLRPIHLATHSKSRSWILIMRVWNTMLKIFEMGIISSMLQSRVQWAIVWV